MATERAGMVDPDPFTIANTFMQAAALILQFVQLKNAQPGPVQLPAPVVQSVGELETHADQCIRKGHQLLRIVERGTANADVEFYDQEFRTGHSLMLDMPSHMLFKQELSMFMTTVANTGHWVNHIIEMDPALAGRLGASLNQSLGDMAHRLNRIMEKGLPNREAVQAAKETLAALANAIEAELGNRN